MEAVSLEHSSQGKVFWKLPYTWTNGELTWVEIEKLQQLSV
jgi:hypothetical protein